MGSGAKLGQHHNIGIRCCERATHVLLRCVGVADAVSHGKEEQVLAEDLGEGQGDGDGAALAGQVGLDTVDDLGGLDGRRVVPVVGVREPGLSTRLSLEAEGVLRADCERAGVRCTLEFEPGARDFRDSRFFHSSLMYLVTSSTTLSGVMSGTRRSENLPMTVPGMTVLVPGSAKAP